MTKAVEGKYYDKDGVEAYECKLAPNNAVVLCELSISKGDGAAVDAFRAVLNKSCPRVLKVTLITEE